MVVDESSIVSGRGAYIAGRRGFMPDRLRLRHNGFLSSRPVANEWTILRASWFAQNFSEGHLLEPVLEGTVALPAGDVAEPFIDADDIANVAVAAFTDRRHVGQLYELTGPRLLTFADAVAEIGAAAGRKLNYVPISAAEYESMLAQYAPPEFANWLSALFTEVLDGRNAHLNDGVQRALGRPPRDFADYARAAAATGVWNATAR